MFSAFSSCSRHRRRRSANIILTRDGMEGREEDRVDIQIHIITSDSMRIQKVEKPQGSYERRLSKSTLKSTNLLVQVCFEHPFESCWQLVLN